MLHSTKRLERHSDQLQHTQIEDVFAYPMVTSDETGAEGHTTSKSARAVRTFRWASTTNAVIRWIRRIDRAATETATMSSARSARLTHLL